MNLTQEVNITVKTHLEVDKIQSTPRDHENQ